jgi:hypothetical protein
MQIINDPGIASSLASSLGSGINQLAELKLAQLTKQYDQQQEKHQFTKTWEPLLGKASANFLSNLSPKERENALGDITSLMQLNEAPSSHDQVSGMRALSSGQQQSQQQNGMQQYDRGYFLKRMLGQTDQQDSLLSGLQGGQPQQMQQQPEQPDMQQSRNDPRITPEKAKLIENLFSTPEQRLSRQKEERENRKLAVAEQLAEKKINLGETKTYITDLKNREKAAKEANMRLKKMETLIDKGNLPNAALWSALSQLENAPFISGLTAPIAELLKGGLKWYSGDPADIEEFEKLSNEFIKNAKQYFGTKVTEKEILEYMKTVPTLMQTDAGKKRVIQNIRETNELVEIESKAARSIIAKNGGIRPIDLDQQVQDKIGNKVDKVARNFIARS